MSKASEVKTDRSYTKDHEWAQPQGAEVLVGITAFAVDQLGDITLVNLDVKPGSRIEAGKAFGTIESVKTLSDLYAPISGTVTRVNEKLETEPELVNADPWAAAWMIAVKPDDAGAVKALLDAGAYSAHVEQSSH
ncbi:MAG TPA: glycine cleavage system protein GcvH [Polyangiaceae bacterium]|nr:glycine cleavage system protein GcvH [Polyangiaceae bacterium]